MDLPSATGRLSIMPKPIEVPPAPVEPPPPQFPEPPQPYPEGPEIVPGEEPLTKPQPRPEELPHDPE